MQTVLRLSLLLLSAMVIASANAAEADITIGPQAGSQVASLATSADISVYGGVAGPGKSYSLLLETLRHVRKPGFGAVVFRRTYPEIKNVGGLWDTSREIFGKFRDEGQKAEPKESTLEWVFPSGARVKFAHLQTEDDCANWDGSEVPLICFDQLEHFTSNQFFRLFARNRTTCGTKPYIRATANPINRENVIGGWLRELMSWWIDDDTGLAIEERSGVIRWFHREVEEVHWADTPEELQQKFGKDAEPTSFTFIKGKLQENKKLLEKDPRYLSRLKGLPLLYRRRLLEGDWNAREQAGMYFRRHWFPIVDAAPTFVDAIRYWDRAATPAERARKRPGSSWTAGVCMGKDARGVFYLTDVIRLQGSAKEVQDAIKNTATQDGENIRVGIEQDPGQAGVVEAQLQIKNLAGDAIAHANPVRDPKGTRALMLSAQAEAGNVILVRGTWNNTLLQELENFDGSGDCLADQVDAASGAFLMLTKKKRAGTWGRR